MTAKQVEYQCPFGLVLHFYWNDEFEEQMEKIKCINALSGWGSMSTMSCAKGKANEARPSINALSGWYSISIVDINEVVKKFRDCINALSG